MSTRTKKQLSLHTHIAPHSPNLYDRAYACNDALGTAVLLVASVEALVNDIANYLEWMHEEISKLAGKQTNFDRLLNKKPANFLVTPWGNSLSKQEIEILQLLGEEGFEYNKIDSKIEQLLQLCGANSTKTDQVLKDFQLLVAVRNQIVHPKKERLTQKAKDGMPNGNVSGSMNHVKELVRRKLITPIEVPDSWLNKLENEFRDWSVSTTSTIFETVLNSLPQTKLMENVRTQLRVS